MTYTQTELTEIISTRTCHDLIGNIGTLKNALDFIGADGVVDAETRNLLETASFLLNARQKFFRMAFGIETHAQTLDELLLLCQNYLDTVGTRGHGIKLVFSGITPQLSKPICLCVMVAADIFIKGGEISVAVNKNNIIVHAKTDYKFRESEILTYQQIIRGEKPNDNISQYAQLIYLRALLGEDVPMNLAHTETEMKLVIG